MHPATFMASPSARDVQAVAAIAPLAVGRTLQCGPFRVPVAVVASEATLEREQSEAAEVVRRFILDDPWSGMGSVRAGGWMLLARNEDTIVVGQREGAIGLGKVVTLTQTGEEFEAQSMGSWSLASGDTAERAESISLAGVEGSTLLAEWDCGTTSRGRPDRVVSRVEVAERPDEVHVLVWSMPSVAQRLADDVPDDRLMLSVGTGMSTVDEINLSGPLGARRVMNDFRVPPQLVAL